MDPTGLLGILGERLDRIGCAWFVTGSVASTVFGEPRFTNFLADSFTGDEWYARRAGQSARRVQVRADPSHRDARRAARAVRVAWFGEAPS